MRKRRLLWQLYPSYLLIILLALLAVGWIAWFGMQQTYNAQVERDLISRAHFVQQLIAAPLHARQFSTVDAVCKTEGRATATRITVIMADGTVIADSDAAPATMENHAYRPEILAAQATGLGVATRHSRTLGVDMMYVALRTPEATGQPITVRTSLPLAIVQHPFVTSSIRFFIAVAIIALAAALLSLLISRRITYPLEAMTAIAIRFSQGDLTQRIPPQPTRELDDLAEGMNHMAVHLDERIRTALRQRNEQEAMLLSMTEGILAVDNNEQVLKLNQAAASLLGINPITAQGRSIQEAIRNSDLQQFIARVLLSDDSIEGEIVLGTRRNCYMQLHGTVLADEDGRRIGALVVMNDVTRLRRLETVRRDFVANVSHELKTPITSIKGFVETLLDGSAQDPADIQRFLAIIAKHTDRMSAIIEDLLSLSRLEQQSETTTVSLMDTPLRPVLVLAMQNCETQAQEKEIVLECQGDPLLHAAIYPPLLEQAVTNLIDNAIKYSDPQSVIRIAAASEEAGGVVISVQDQGCGISPEHLPRLFERFYRVDTGRSRRLGGTGLGLAIVKHIAQVHQGTVSVESVPGEGSTFSIHLLPNTAMVEATAK